MSEHLSPPNPSSFIELQSVDSTNNYARRLIDEGLAVPGTAIFAHEQYAGRGQRSNEWLSEPGENIILTILLNPAEIPLAHQFHLNAGIAAGVHRFFAGYAGEETSIKWPNDLYWRDRKAGGILIESIIRNNEWLWAIAGIGININQASFDESLPNPVSLKQITGKTYNPLDLAKLLTQEISENFKSLVKDGFDDLYNYYTTHLYKKGQVVKFKKDNRTFEASIIDVTRDGNIRIQHAIEEEFRFGEIHWLT